MNIKVTTQTLEKQVRARVVAGGGCILLVAVLAAASYAATRGASGGGGATRTLYPAAIMATQRECLFSRRVTRVLPSQTCCAYMHILTLTLTLTPTLTLTRTPTLTLTRTPTLTRREFIGHVGTKQGTRG
jgi:hypothetical protein